MTTFMFRRLAASMALVALGGALAAACGGDTTTTTTTTTTGGTTSGGDKPNGGTLNPPTVNDGTGKPSNATDVTCQEATQCGNWSCDCSDGYVVYSAFCKNGYCLDAAGACTDACTTSLWSHGKWSGTAGGGPGSDSSSATGSSSSSGGAGGSGGSGAGGSPPSCLDFGAACTDPQQCCSLDCNLGTCN
jgi:hypothetical protein